MKRVAVRSVGATVVSLAVMLCLFPSPALAAIPTLTRSEILARAESAIGADYTWGQESWTPNALGAGPDCSGLVLKCWETPRSMLYQEEDGVNASISPRYTTYSFFNGLGPWTTLSDRASLQPGDALVYNTGSSGHVVLYAEGDGWNYPIVYEAPYTGATVRRASRYLGSEYKPIRRSGLATANSLILDNPTAKSTGGDDVAGSWTRSTSTAGYFQADYQVCAATTDIAWARWTPRFASAGYYNVYLRWTSGWNRASNAKVTVNTPGGQIIARVDQRSNGGAWVKVGRYYFVTGYSTGGGSVAIHATGADGYVVADAAYFALSVTAP
jgi:hypothetical protein